MTKCTGCIPLLLHFKRNVGVIKELCQETWESTAKRRVFVLTSVGELSSLSLSLTHQKASTYFQTSTRRRIHNPHVYIHKSTHKDTHYFVRLEDVTHGSTCSLGFRLGDFCCHGYNNKEKQQKARISHGLNSEIHLWKSCVLSIHPSSPCHPISLSHVAIITANNKRGNKSTCVHACRQLWSRLCVRSSAEEWQAQTNEFPVSYIFIIFTGSVIIQLCTSICSCTD